MENINYKLSKYMKKHNNDVNNELYKRKVDYYTALAGGMNGGVIGILYTPADKTKKESNKTVSTVEVKKINDTKQIINKTNEEINKITDENKKFLEEHSASAESDKKKK